MYLYGLLNVVVEKLSIISIPSLRHNGIDANGGVALFEALRGMTNLQHLK